jgi:AcrR family transcriptional regulator
MPTKVHSDDATERLSADDRREMLLDFTKSLVLERGTAAVTMGTVAERADVTRALVYKHFQNRDHLLAALYRRETNRLNAAMTDVVGAAPDGFAAKLRAFVRAALAASEEHAVFFAPLRSFGSQSDSKTDRRSWDRRTVKYFAQLAVDDFGIDQRTARSAIAIQLSGIQTLLSQLRARPGPEQRAFLEHVYVEGAIGALVRLAAAPPATS